MNNQLSKKIMRQVYLAYFFRRALHPLMMKVYVLGVVFVGVSILTSVPSVLQNMPHRVDNLYSFSSYAFTHTDLIVQFLVVLGGAVMLWLAVDTVRALGSHSTPQHASY